MSTDSRNWYGFAAVAVAFCAFVAHVSGWLAGTRQFTDLQRIESEAEARGEAAARDRLSPDLQMYQCAWVKAEARAATNADDRARWQEIDDASCGFVPIPPRPVERIAP